jgi:hypothetical protein
MPVEIILLGTLAALFQVAGLMLLMRGVVWAFGAKARDHFFYGILTVGSMPFIRLARVIIPKAVPDSYIPAFAFALVFLIWLTLALGHQSLCVSHGVQCA